MTVFYFAHQWGELPIGTLQPNSGNVHVQSNACGLCLICLDCFSSCPHLPQSASLNVKVDLNASKHWNSSPNFTSFKAESALPVPWGSCFDWNLLNEDPLKFLKLQLWPDISPHSRLPLLTSHKFVLDVHVGLFLDVTSSPTSRTLGVASETPAACCWVC